MGGGSRIMMVPEGCSWGWRRALFCLSFCVVGVGGIGLFVG